LVLDWGSGQVIFGADWLLTVVKMSAERRSAKEILCEFLFG